MKSVLRILVYVPLALLFLFFAMANRAPVRVFLDPLPGGDASGLSFETPLYLVVLAAMGVGVLAGGCRPGWRMGVIAAPPRPRAPRPRRRAAKRINCAVKASRAYRPTPAHVAAVEGRGAVTERASLKARSFYSLPRAVVLATQSR